jgi:hypothetical protein
MSAGAGEERGIDGTERGQECYSNKRNIPLKKKYPEWREGYFQCKEGKPGSKSGVINLK